MSRLFDHPLTIVEAPMGYGKTTAVREYLKNNNVKVLWQRVYDSSITAFWTGFCRLFAELDASCSESLVQFGFPNDSVSLREALRLIEYIKLPDKTVIVIDDYHLINTIKVNNFIKFLAVNEIANLCIVLTARFVEFSNLEELALKGYLHHITKETLEFSRLKSIFEKIGVNSRSLLKQYFDEKS